MFITSMMNTKNEVKSEIDIRDLSPSLLLKITSEAKTAKRIFFFFGATEAILFLISYLFDYFIFI